MKKYILLSCENTVLEIIPELNPMFPNVPIEKRYTPEFVSSLIEVDENTEVQIHWIYDSETQTFSEPPVPEVVEPEQNPEEGGDQ